MKSVAVFDAKVLIFLHNRTILSNFAAKFKRILDFNVSMLRIAVQSKGRLFEDTMNLLAEADIKDNQATSPWKCFISVTMIYLRAWPLV